ncbi:outer membrane protein [Bradyrhizobium canariense]|uniref:outer membrane protein n=1 Tax=Bradyrhizobium canariense TaxID=255045 RepID=UPI001B89FE56|nr:outer membrane beta-barrel protein [Bradyrhizobium canariense]MBR0950936.1 porin family protein [Bradyrhizobium canariense]
MNKHFGWALAAASLLSIGISGTASAADLAARPYTKAPPPPVAFNWSGCYLGAYVGGATQSRNVRTADPTSTGGTFPAGTFYNSPTATAANGGLFDYGVGSSAIGGGTLGCNWQGASPWVVGIEGEGGYMRLTGSTVDPYSIPLLGGDTTASTRIGDWYASVSGRVGYAWDRVLVYGKGGVGFAEIRSSIVDTCTTGACGGGLLTATGGRNQAFWVAGGGLEYAFDRSWSVKGEYLFLGIDKTYAVCGPGAAAATGSTFCSNHNIEGIHTFKVGVNYRFNTPLVAKY